LAALVPAWEAFNMNTNPLAMNTTQTENHIGPDKVMDVRGELIICALGSGFQACTAKKLSRDHMED
jgi:hypothetical protein